jgi:hypothetical protein
MSSTTHVSCRKKGEAEEEAGGKGEERMSAVELEVG